MAGRDLVGGGGALDQTKKRKNCGDDRPSNSFLGSMVSFGGVNRVNGSENCFYQSFENGDEYLDDYFNQPEKKRRLSVDQVQFLERSFEAENKLEPERKVQLANELGLQPRQIAVWFQNRRARCKTKNLETEYDTLHASYNSLKTDYDCLVKENEKLKAEVLRLKHNGFGQDSEGANLGLCETKEAKEASTSKTDEGSTKSDVTNEERINPCVVESGESSHEFDPIESVLSRNGEDWLNIFPKIEDAYCHATPRGYGFGVEDHAFSFWSY